MKITIAYIAEEERAAGEALAALRQLCPGGPAPAVPRREGAQK